MNKATERDYSGTFWDRAHDKEPIFILMARDCCAPEAIRYWTELRDAVDKNTPLDGQIQDALETARDMEAYQREVWPEKALPGMDRYALIQAKRVAEAISALRHLIFMARANRADQKTAFQVYALTTTLHAAEAALSTLTLELSKGPYRGPDQFVLEEAMRGFKNTG